jgi:hypothetical protein
MSNTCPFFNLSRDLRLDYGTVLRWADRLDWNLVDRPELGTDHIPVAERIEQWRRWAEQEMPRATVELIYLTVMAEHSRRAASATYG